MNYRKYMSVSLIR